MPNREYDLTIQPDGRVELTVSGHPGPACLQVAELFRQLVGELESSRPTHEFYAPAEHVRLDVDQSHRA